MNCKHIQELLPLYVGRDLDEKQNESVAAHVRSCTACAHEAARYAAARELFMRFDPPPVGEAVYAGIRLRVLDEIDRGRERPGLRALLTEFFGRPMRLGAVAALLLVVSVFAYYFVTLRSAEGPAADYRTQDQRQADEPQNVPLPAPSPERGVETTRVASVEHGHASLRGKSSPAKAKRPAVARAPQPRTLTANTLPKGDKNRQPETLAVSDATTMRLEMQTGDPNIRIIWFTPQPGKQDQE